MERTAILPVLLALVTSLLVRYFDWRGRLMRRVRAGATAASEIDKAA